MTAKGARALGLWFTTLVLFYLPSGSKAQSPGSFSQHYSDFWIGLNVDLRLNKRWSLLTESELKRKDFMASPNAFFACLGVQYRIMKGLNAHVAVGRQWVVADEPFSLVVMGETRLQVQAVAHQSIGRFRFRERIRNEFRWLDRLPNDPKTGKEFHDRIRVLLGMEFRPFRKTSLPSFIAYDEFLEETATSFHHPAFDQNRIFIGLRQPITQALAAESGYIHVYASSGSPGISERHDVLKIGFNWSPALHKREATDLP